MIGAHQKLALLNWYADEKIQPIRSLGLTNNESIWFLEIFQFTQKDFQIGAS